MDVGKAAGSIAAGGFAVCGRSAQRSGNLPNAKSGSLAMFAATRRALSAGAVGANYKGTRASIRSPFLWMSAQVVCDHVDCLAEISSVVQTNKRHLLRCAHSYQSINNTRNIAGAGF